MKTAIQQAAARVRSNTVAQEFARETEATIIISLQDKVVALQEKIVELIPYRARCDTIDEMPKPEPHVCTECAVATAKLMSCEIQLGALQKTIAEAHTEIGRLTAQVEYRRLDKETLVSCQSECKDLESQLLASQLKVAEFSGRYESARNELIRSERIFNETIKRMDTQQETVSVTGDMEFDIQRGSDGLIRKIVKKG
jgi:hypothetical protein